MRIKNPLLTAIAAAALVGGVFIAGAAAADPATNKALVRDAMNALFVKRDPSAISRYWGSSYIQHNPGIGDGTQALPDLIASLPANFKYEPGLIAADGDLVMIHGRYTGFAPTPLVAVDIFRVKDGKLVEHWDVLQPETPTAKTVSGHPMFDPDE